jgi:mono/diheme cytochrome c family protein/translation initiation factor 2 beta subunit (eIF-2beta)/eIF-5
LKNGNAITRKVAIGLALTLVLVLIVPLLYLREPGRQAEARQRLQGEAILRGAEIYAASCAQCHGVSGGGLIGPPLRGTNLDEEALKKVISRGVSGSVMPAWSTEEGGLLKENQLKDLVTFIKNWDQEAVASAIEEMRKKGYEPPPLPEELQPRSVSPTHYLELAWEELRFSNREAALQYLGHFVQQASADERERGREIIQALERDDEKEALVLLVRLLAEVGPPEEEASKRHLELAEGLLGESYVAEAEHHLEHFVALATGDEKAKGEEVLAALQEGNRGKAHALLMAMAGGEH